MYLSDIAFLMENQSEIVDRILIYLFAISHLSCNSL